MEDNVPDYPVYEKDGNTQIAATPQREVELQFDGWRRRPDKTDDSSAPSQAPKTPKTPTK
jgi:hypothetical protein